MFLKKLINIFRRNTTMKKTGTVKWFDPTKGYGFIAPDNGSKDVFVHRSAVEAAGLDDLQDNQKIEFKIVANQGKESAEDIVLV